MIGIIGGSTRQFSRQVQVTSLREQLVPLITICSVLLELKSSRPSFVVVTLKVRIGISIS